MKKIFFSLVALAALAACTKSEVEYTGDVELSFAPVTRLSTKAAVDGTDYPDALNMFVFANAGETTDALPAGYDEPYFANAEFTHNPVRVPALTLSENVFAGVTPYYWPNVKKLIFSGYSKSGNVELMTPKPTYVWNTYVKDGETVRKLGSEESVGSYTVERQAWEIEMQNYTPGSGKAVSGDNDLMWFPTTTESYGKPATANYTVNVEMKHACSWVTINVKGDATTGKTGTTWQILDLTIADLAQKGDVVLGTAASWKNLSDVKTFDVYEATTGKALTDDYVDYTKLTYQDFILIPQATKTLTVKYSYVSQAGGAAGGKDIVIEEIKNIPLTYRADNNVWEPGVHYTYNITIGTQEILIEPTVEFWNPVKTDAEGNQTSGSIDTDITLQ